MAAPRGGRQLHRRSDPESGCSTQQDPIGLAGGLNSYGYADGDPINFSDPFGLKSCAKDLAEKELEECEKKEADERQRKEAAYQTCQANGIAALRGTWLGSIVVGSGAALAGKVTTLVAGFVEADATATGAAALVRAGRLRASAGVAGRYVTAEVIAAAQASAAASASTAGTAATVGAGGTAALWTGTVIAGLGGGYALGVQAMCKVNSNYYEAQ